MSGKQDYQPVVLEEPLLPVVRAEAEATSNVEVVAPATLPEGYSFEAEVGDGIITVTVPHGGVEQGQRFTVPAKDATVPQRSSAHAGTWKDGLFDCCAYGPCHPQVCLTYWCAPIALGQVMQRMNLTWFADYTGPSRASKTCATIAWLFAGYIILQYTLALVMGAIQGSYSTHTTYNSNGYDPYHSSSSSSTQAANLPASYFILYFLQQILQLAFFVFMVVIITKTRSYIRNKYAIPEHTCEGCEDCCCSFWCGSCTICQMARHTADYDTYQARCCTGTGLPPNAPAIV